MKEIVFILCSLFLFSGCSNDDEIEPKVIKPEIIFYEGFVGEKQGIIFEANADQYIFKNNNPEILSWEYSEKQNKAIEIKSLSNGSGTIDVLNTGNDTLFIICIQSYYLSSSHMEEVAMHPTERCEVTVDAQNIEVKQLIESELWKQVDQKRRTLYTFDAQTWEFTMTPPNSEQKFQGTYEWNIDSLVLKYNDITERYGFKVAAGRICYLIFEDKTKEYQSLYPDAGIELVKIKRILYNYDMEIPHFGLH